MRAPFKKCRTEINETFADEANFINITLPMYNFTEYSDNYSGSLWGFKRDELTNNANVTKCKAKLIGNTKANGTKK